MKKTLVSATQYGDTLLCSYRREDGTIINDVETAFKHYFYAPIVSSRLEPFLDKSRLQKVILDKPYDMYRVRDYYGDITYESDVTFDRRYFLDNPDLIDDTVKWNVSWVDIEARMKAEDPLTGEIRRYDINEIRNGETYITAITKVDVLFKRVIAFTLTKNIDETLVVDSILGNKLTRLNKDDELSDVELLEKKNKALELLDGFTIEIITCDTEEELLDKFLNDLHEYQPDLFTGWNFHFDYVTIYNRCCRLNMSHRLSLFEKYAPKVNMHLTEGGVEMFNYKTPGYYVVDYLDIYKKRNTGEEESYKLDYITRKWDVELPKIRYNYNDTDELQDNDEDMFLFYNIVDTLSLYLLDLKTGFCDVSIMLCNKSKCPVLKCTANRVIVDSYLITKLKEKGLIRWTRHNKEKVTEKYEGAFVQAIHGYYNYYMCDLDATSMYPNIMMSLNISPETLVKVENIGMHKPENLITSACGVKFKKNKKGIVPELLEGLFIDRKNDKSIAKDYGTKYKETNDPKYKDLQTIYWNKQLAEKVILNSFYGVLGDPKYDLYEKDIAKSVTLTGQALIKWTIKVLEDNNYIRIYTDTDSCYVLLKKAEDYEFEMNDETIENIIECVDKINKLYKIVNSTYDDFAKQYNVDKHRFEFKSELLGRNILIQDKKMYAFNVVLDEGRLEKVNKLKTKEEQIDYLKNDKNFELDMEIKGMAIKKVDTPKILCDLLTKLLRFLIDGKIDRSTFEAALESLWEKKILPTIEENPLLLANPRKMNKIPMVKHKLYYAIEEYNNTHDKKIELGERVFFFDIKGSEKAIVYKMDENPKRVNIDYSKMYESTYKAIKKGLLFAIKNGDI